MWSQMPPDPFFSDAFVAELFENYDIEPEKQARVRRLLDRAATNWRQASDLDVPLRDQREVLATLGRHSGALKAVLHEIPATTWHKLTAASAMFDSGEFSEPRLTNTSPPSWDPLAETEPTLIVPASDPADVTGRITVTQLVQALDLLSSLGDIAVQMMPPVKPGVQIDYPLRYWMMEIQRLWQVHLQRKFTRDVDAHGAPITDAACFCVEVFRQMEPQTPRSRVLNEMKIAIQTKRTELEEFRTFGPKLFQR